MGIAGHILDKLMFSDLSGVVLDEDDMASNSDQHVPTQQSTKAYTDSIKVKNSVYVSVLSDFPTPVAGKIILASNTTYFILDNINIGTDNFVVPDNSNTNIEGGAFNNQALTYEGTGVMFENSGGIDFLRIELITLVNTGSGTLINPTPGTNPLAQVSILQCLVTGFSSLGTWTIRPFINESAFVDNVDGFTFNDTSDFRFEDNIMFNTSDLATVFVTFGASGTLFGVMADVTITAQSTEKAIDIKGTIASDSLLRITENSFRGSGSVLNTSSLDQKDVRVFFSGNDGFADSRTIGSFISQGNDVATVISTIGIGQSNYVDLDLGEASGSITVFASNGSGGTTVTSASHLQPDEKLVSITGSTSYNGEHEIFNRTANTYDIDAAFVANDATGTWTSGALAGIDIERWQMIDASNGLLKFIGKDTFDAEYSATISALAVGGASRRYKFRLAKSTDDGVSFVGGFSIPVEINNTVSNISFREPLMVNTNDLVKLQVANFESTNNVIVDTVSAAIE